SISSSSVSRCFFQFTNSYHGFVRLIRFPYLTQAFSTGGHHGAKQNRIPAHCWPQAMGEERPNPFPETNPPDRRQHRPIWLHQPDPRRGERPDPRRPRPRGGGSELGSVKGAVSAD